MTAVSTAPPIVLTRRRIRVIFMVLLSKVGLPITELRVAPGPAAS